MDYVKIGELLFMTAFTLPCVVLVLVPLVEIRYGNTYLLGAFFDRNLNRDEHPVWFWTIEVFQFLFGLAIIAKIWPLWSDLISALV